MIIIIRTILEALWIQVWPGMRSFTLSIQMWACASWLPGHVQLRYHNRVRASYVVREPASLASYVRSYAACKAITAISV